MCRFVAYRGKRVPLAHVISEPEHSLVEQSYQPKEMTAGTVNVDGFGVGWYNRALESAPCVYTNIIPIWSDRNLPGLSRHIASDCILANVRGATPGFGLDQSNCQPFAYERLLFMHNGFIENFRGNLGRKIRDSLGDEYYRLIQGTTDSEHIFALVLNFLHGREYTQQTLVAALQGTVAQLLEWTYGRQMHMALNIVLSDGECVVALRFANSSPAPSLYYLPNSPAFPDGVVIASEKLSAHPEWRAVPEGHLVTCSNAFDVHVTSLSGPDATEAA